jgi:hypothetical protein
MWNVGGSHLYAPWLDLPPVAPGERILVDFCVRVSPDLLPAQDHLAVENTAGPDLVFSLWTTSPPYELTSLAGSSVRLRWSCPGQNNHNFRQNTAIDDVRVYLEPLPDASSTFCSGTSCPCGNDDPLAGCVNSTGQGALLATCGPPSVSSDALVLTATGCPPGNNALVVMGAATFAPLPTGDGKLCTGGLFRFFPGTVDAQGTFVEDSLVASAPPGSIRPGDTRHFQLWTRDVLCGPPPAPCASPCGTNGNLTNGVSVTFSP